MPSIDGTDHGHSESNSKGVRLECYEGQGNGDEGRKKSVVRKRVSDVKESRVMQIESSLISIS